MKKKVKLYSKKISAHLKSSLRNIRVIDVTNLMPMNGGNFSEYYRLSKHRGLKVLREFEESKSELLRSHFFSEAKHEFRMMKACACSIVPKAYAVVAVRDGSVWHPGILMQHARGKTLEDVSGMRFSDRIELCEKAEARFRKLTGREHNDLHEGNLIYHAKSKRYKVIDFTPGYVR